VTGAGEGNHVSGRDGVDIAQRWLDSTARFQVLWTVYDNESEVSPPLLKRCDSFDMTGKVLSGSGRFFAEVKHHNYPNNQSPEFRRFLGRAYSATAFHLLKNRPDPRLEFMWITWHPFDQTKWRNLCTKDEVLHALKNEGKQYLNDDSEIDDTIISSLVSRLWLIVLSPRQEDLIMSDEYLGIIRRYMVDQTR
jgi:hypothetical protein